VSNGIGSRLDGRDNALNFLRLALASAVIVGHAWPLGGLGTSRLEGISGVAVDGFFALSGFLIAGSRMRLSMNDFLVRRCLRILPGFWVCLIAVAFVFAPLAALMAGEGYVLGSALDYVRTNAALTQHQWGVDHTLVDVPYDGVWNGSLWTLEYEFAAYVAAGLLLGLAWVRRRPALVLMALVAIVLIAQPIAHGPLHVTTNQYLNTLRLGGYFVAGMAAWSVRDRLPLRADLMVAAAASVVLVFCLVDGSWFDTLLTVPLTYVLLALGARLRVRIGAVNDVSYGVYIYAFPVAQLLVLAGAADLGVAGFSVLVLAGTLPVAWASWLLVERPCLRLAGRLTGSRRRVVALQPA
jgi:peptidoglycan/LPS O-acetylase OafA/YrhL